MTTEIELTAKEANTLCAPVALTYKGRTLYTAPVPATKV